uniref:NADH-ubiquinone oxidoreductase chain 6 n=1 Tax=Pseudoniphargus sp. 6-Morocco A TaxID=2291047 RepID=A0A345UEB6_9CRUS|nr:NADH dehydrogenase subunit 6 [Pseudoniphargus sp. 6-Morocco A]
MTQFFSLCSIILSFMFLLETPPLFLSMVIILQTIILALIISLFTMSSWFSFMLLMIYLSGMMIIFIYVSSMASNEMFHPKSRLFPLLLSLMLVFMALFLINDAPLPSDSINILDLSLIQNTTIKISKMYSKSLSAMTILLIIYLLLAMIMVTNNSSFSEGPMRSAK